jgi:NADH-quinone oxidoreductase subunit L
VLEWLWLVVALPLAGSAVLFASRGQLPGKAVAAIGVGSTGLSALAAGLAGIEFLGRLPSGATVFREHLGNWITAGGFSVEIGLYLDALSLVMMLVVTVVGFLIHLYSARYMAGEEEGYSRFFASMNLFMAAMLTLVLADNLLLLYLGWEGVGLCSYLLIGFWYRDPANGLAARKAFVVTRVGDAAMTIGIILLFTSLGSLDIQELAGRAAQSWPTGSGIAVAAAALLLCGALGKSAQLPLQTWLPDAMAGPTPVSALIHAATMVTAGVYLIARMHVLYTLAPVVQLAVAVIGALTLLLASCSALAQDDIKRVLAYSTMSQIGYMFLALGVGAWGAAIFHFMTHAFFKALLFLAAGSVIVAAHHERSIFKLGGWRRRLPVAFLAFLIGAGALAAVPLVTSGFYSKDEILMSTWRAGTAGHWLWLAGVAGAFLTAIYIFRVVFVVFFGDGEHASAARASEEPVRQRYAILVPLITLSALSVLGGFVNTPEGLGHVTLFSSLIATSLPPAQAAAESRLENIGLELVAACAPLAGIVVAYLLYFPGRARPARRTASRWQSIVHRAWASGWGFDRMYGAAFVTPFVAMTRALRGDAIDRLYDGLAFSIQAAWRTARRSETGKMRWYAAGMLAGVIVVLTISLFA